MFDDDNSQEKRGQELRPVFVPLDRPDGRALPKAHAFADIEGKRHVAAMGDDGEYEPLDDVSVAEELLEEQLRVGRIAGEIFERSLFTPGQRPLIDDLLSDLGLPWTQVAAAARLSVRPAAVCKMLQRIQERTAEHGCDVSPVKVRAFLAVRRAII